MDELNQIIQKLNMNFNINSLEDCQTLLYLIYNNSFKLQDPILSESIGLILGKVEEQLLKNDNRECYEPSRQMEDPMHFTPSTAKFPERKIINPFETQFSMFASFTLLNQIFNNYN